MGYGVVRNGVWSVGNGVWSVGNGVRGCEEWGME